MGISATYIYRDGQYAGKYDYVNKQSVMAENNNQASTQAKPEAAAKADSKAERGFWQQFLFGGPSPIKLTDCGGDVTPKKVFDDDGVTVFVPKAPPNGDIFESGAVRVDDTIYLPVDPDGDPVLPDDIFFQISGKGGFFQVTPDILLESPYLALEGLRNLELQVEKGTDSTTIEFDSNGDRTLDASMGCYSDLINMEQLSPEALALTPEEREMYGITSCPEAGYESFVVCPSDPGNRPRIYLGSYTLESYKYVGLDQEGNPKYELADTKRVELSDVDELLLDPEKGNPIPVVCEENAEPITLNIPREWHSDGTLYLKLRFSVIVDAREADGNANYKTHLRVRIKSQEE